MESDPIDLVSSGHPAGAKAIQEQTWMLAAYSPSNPKRVVDSVVLWKCKAGG